MKDRKITGNDRVLTRRTSYGGRLRPQLPTSGMVLNILPATPRVLPEQLSPLDWVTVTDRRDGKNYVAHGQEQAEAFEKAYKEGEIVPALKALKVRIHHFEVHNDEEITELNEWITAAAARWDKAHEVRRRAK